MLRCTLAGLCPRCTAASIFAGRFEMRTACPNCGLALDADGSPTLAAMIVTYGLALAGSLALAIWLFSGGHLEGRELWAIIPFAIAAVLGAHRPAKAWWTWLMWRMDQLGDPPERASGQGMPE